MPKPASFRKSLYDYDVEQAALAYLHYGRVQQMPSGLVGASAGQIH